MPAVTSRAPRLRRSRYLSFFRKKDEIYAYHDLWGYILQMDAKVHEFVESFGPSGRSVAEVARAWRDRFRPEEIEGFIGTFKQHRCLVAPRADEEAEAFEKGYPSLAAWTVSYAPRGGETAILAYKDRAVGRVLLDRLDRIGTRLYHQATGERTLAEIACAIAADLGLDEDAVAGEVARLAFRLAHSDRQVLKLTDRPLFEYLAYPPPYLRSTMPYRRIDDPAASADAPDVVDLAHFHRAEIEDAQAQFDVEETTLSHMFREPHPALGGKSYGAAFADALIERGLLPPAGARARVLEVGGGVGFFALRLLERLAAARRGNLAYLILDLSQVLQESQRLLHEAGGRVKHILGNAARALPFRDGALDLIISNEVIADFTTVRLRRDDLRGKGGARGGSAAAARGGEDPLLAEARAFVAARALPLDDAPEVFWLNYGALRFVEECARALAPGGAAVLVEFGGLARYPVESTHLAHSEFSIHFGHLKHVAEHAGLAVEMTDVMEFLALRGDVRVLATTRTFFECLRALLDRRGISLQKLAYTEDQFRELLGGRIDAGALRGPVFKPVRERALGLHPPEFQVAILRKPR